jgi:hypothetical protein
VSRLRRRYFDFIAAHPGRKPLFYDQRTWTALPRGFRKPK